MIYTAIPSSPSSHRDEGDDVYKVLGNNKNVRVISSSSRRTWSIAFLVAAVVLIVGGRVLYKNQTSNGFQLEPSFNHQYSYDPSLAAPFTNNLQQHPATGTADTEEDEKDTIDLIPVVGQEVGNDKEQDSITTLIQKITIDETSGSSMDSKNKQSTVSFSHHEHVKSSSKVGKSHKRSKPYKSYRHGESSSCSGSSVSSKSRKKHYEASNSRSSKSMSHHKHSGKSSGSSKVGKSHKHSKTSKRKSHKHGKSKSKSHKHGKSKSKSHKHRKSSKYIYYPTTTASAQQKSKYDYELLNPIQQQNFDGDEMHQQDDDLKQNDNIELFGNEENVAGVEEVEEDDATLH